MELKRLKPQAQSTGYFCITDANKSIRIINVNFLKNLESLATISSKVKNLKELMSEYLMKEEKLLLCIKAFHKMKLE